MKKYDFDDDFIEDLDDEEEEYYEDELPSGMPDRKALIGLGVLGAVILVMLIVLFVVFLNGSRKERESVEAQLGLWEEIPEEESAGGSLSDDKDSFSGEDRETGDKGEKSEMESAIPSPSPEASPVSEVQTEITAGALDDAQDPQAGGAAGNESAGAEVTVVPLGADETRQLTMGIDVSKYQGTIDWAKVKASGVEFAMIRAGYRAKSTGEIFEDPTARYNMQEAQAAGIRLGVYFFSSAVTMEEARAEAAFTKELIAKYRITYPVAYNCEDFQSADSRQHGLSVEERTNLACAFLDEISAGGYTPMFYAARSELEGNAQWNTGTLASKYKIWVAQYPDQPYPQTTASSYSGTHDMWQYTSQGKVDGISGKVDVNLAYFGYAKEAEAKDEAPAEVVEANPEVGIIFTEVNETVTAKQETNLRNQPSTQDDGSIVAKLVHGDTAVRTGIGHNGWSRLIYNGQTLYAVTSYLTTDMEDTGQQAPPQGPVYTPVSEQVTAKIETNLRTVPSTASDDTVVGVLHNGETLTRTAIGDNGWSQLDYNGQTVYAVSSFLMTQ
ncbi:MAG: glycoside hydrolase family 25 [Lachnospiraceae bacterium]|nr:glycoside hydrolase family 25 [Lachnospiraceae bacterium]